MTSVKLRFIPSGREGVEGSVYFQLICKRVVRLVDSGHCVFPSEWDTQVGVVVQGPRFKQLVGIRLDLLCGLARLKRIVSQLELEHSGYTADDVVSAYRQLTEKLSLNHFMDGLIVQLKSLGRIRTAETYRVTQRCFSKFLQLRDVAIDGINSELMRQYEAWLKGRGVCKNTVSFYMRILRSVYNRAVEAGLTVQNYPFRHVYTGIDKTVKRAVSVETIKALKNLNLEATPSLVFARDIFLFSFYTRGMSFIDIALLKKTYLCNGVLTYRRRKTGQRLSVKWEFCMQTIVDRYADDSSEYLLPIIKRPDMERRQYTNALHLVNVHLKKLSDMLGLQRPLSMYVARHSWASAARTQNIPLSVISEGMGHDSETTTQIYLASIETSAVDDANKKIIDLL